MFLGAVMKGDIKTVKRMLAELPDLIRTVDPGSEETALHLAASFGHKDIVELLLHAGADVNAEAYYHYTPLGSAERENQTEIAKLLKDWGGKNFD